MQGFKAIVRKEISEHFSSYRFIILFALITMVSLILVYLSGMEIQDRTSGSQMPRFLFLFLFSSSSINFSLVQFVAFFGPLIGLILGFDSVNRERNEGTLSKILSQPIYRDAVINGKFAAGVIIVAVMLVSIVMVITGLGLVVLGIQPGIEEFWRIMIFLLISIMYVSLWLGVAILFSVMFRSITTSALASIAVWIFFSFFLSLGVGAIARGIIASGTQSQAEIARSLAGMEKSLSFISPMKLYTDATATIIDPLRKTTSSFAVQMGMMERISMSRFSGPLPLLQSFLVTAPYIIFLIALTVICFAVSYIVFMRQEIRSV